LPLSSSSVSLSLIVLLSSKQAADLAVKATENFLNRLRLDVGDHNFDRLFIISPNQAEQQLALNHFSQGNRFRFFTPHLSACLKKDDRLWAKFKRFFRKLFKGMSSIWTVGILKDEINKQPTYDLSDQGVNVTDANNFRAAPYIFEKEEI
jgi:hypothetical protein